MGQQGRKMGCAKRTFWASETLYVLLALLLSLAAALPLLLGPGMVATRAGGDSPFLLQRVQQLALALADGVFPVRWMPDANLGLGYPAFNYYAALPYYLAAALHLAGLGLIAAIQLTQVLGFALGGLASYALGRQLRLKPAGALTASALFTFAPFHLVNVYMRGDSLSEFWAMGLAALCLYAVVRLREDAGPGGVALLAASYAALVLAHNITALLASPILALTLLAVAWQSPLRWRLLGAGAGALALGLLLSAGFWYPALAERGLVQLGQQTTGYFNFRGHFRGLDLIQFNWRHDYGIAPDADPFRLGLVQTLLTLAGLVAVVWRWRQRTDRALWLTLTVGVLGTTFLITPLSLLLWEHVPLLSYAQFPWRFLGLQAVLAAPLVGLLPELLPRHWQRWTLAGALIALLGLGGLGALKPDRLPLNAADVTTERLLLFEAFSGNVGGTVRAEYLPFGVTPRYYASPQLLDRNLASPPWALSGGELNASLVERRADGQTWWIETLMDERVVFATVYFPGWRALVDGQPVTLSAAEGLGLMTLHLPAGRHLVELTFGPTPVRRAAELASLAGSIILLALIVWWAAGGRRRAWWLGGGMVLAALGLGWLLWRPFAPPMSAPLDGPLVMDLASYPYLHHEPEGLRLGDALLADYSYDNDTLTPGGELAINLTWREIAPQQTLQVRLMPLSGHILDQSIVWVELYAPMDATEQRLTLELPANLPPGIYVPRLGVKLDEETLPIETVRGSPQSRASLAPLWVPRTTFRTQLGEGLANYGPPRQPPELALLKVLTTPIKDKQVEVQLTWRAERPPQRNYALSLRHLDASGVTLEADTVDLAPMSPDYPTGFWRPGEVVETRVLVPVGGKEFAAGDAWRIVLYDRLTLAEIGAMELPVVLEED